ncbi:MAG: tetratricopeptide repeat protein, partial [Abditibacteriales bacterium]|nr:tetratricopeptide repeat protein [Abditibacteriales bacterium]
RANVLTCQRANVPTCQPANLPTCQRGSMNPLLRIGIIVLGVIALMVALNRVDLGGEEERLKRATTDELRRLVEQEPNNLRARFHLAARLGTQEGRYEEAYQVLRPAAEKQPHAEEVQYAFAQLAISTKRLDEAIDALNRVTQINPERTDVHRQLASIYGQIGLFPEVAAKLEPILAAHPEQPPLWDALGKAYLKMGDLDKAEEAYRLLTKRMPKMGSAHVGMGFVWLAKGYPQAAEENFRRGLLSYRVDERAYLGLARLYQQITWTDARLPQIVQEMEDAVRFFPQDAMSHFVLGKAYARQNRVAEALKELHAAARLPGAPAETWQLLAVLYQRAGNTAAAATAEKKYRAAAATEREEKQLKQSAAASPRDAQRQFALARFYVARKNLPAAWIYFTRGLRERQDQPAAKEAAAVRKRLLAGEGVEVAALP